MRDQNKRVFRAKIAGRELLVLHDRGSVATIDGHPIVLATPRAKEPVRRKPRKQLSVTHLLLRRFGLWVIDGPSPTGTTRWNSQVG